MDHWNNVEIEKDGKTDAGQYRVEGGIITVTYDAEGGGDKRAWVLPYRARQRLDHLR